MKLLLNSYNLAMETLFKDLTDMEGWEALDQTDVRGGKPYH